MYKLPAIYRIYRQYCVRLCVLLAGIFACFSPALAQSNSLVPPETVAQAVRIAEKIEQENIISTPPITIAELQLDTLAPKQKLVFLRTQTMDAAFFRNHLPKAELLQLYKAEAQQQTSTRDLKIARLFGLQFNLLNPEKTEEQRKELYKRIGNYFDDKDWFVASRAYLLAASGQALFREFDVGLKDTQSALNLIPNKLGSDYDEARYETYDFISYLQLILYNLEDGIGTTELVLEQGLASNRQIDGISLINNMAFSFSNWREYETAEKLAEILFRINNKSDQGVNALVYYRYAQAQNNAENYRGALVTIDTALENTKDPTRQIGLVSERAIALAGLGRVRAAELEFVKFDKIARLNDLKTGGYSKVRLHAQMLIALAKGDVETANRLQNQRSKIIIQRLLRFQNKGISGLHASLENDKVRQEERADGLKREAELARGEARISKIAALFFGLFALAMLAVVILSRRLIRSLEKEKETMIIANLAAEAGERAKKQFLSVMSHEFRTPLNGIIGIADLLSVHGDTQTLRNQSKIMLESGEGLLALLTGILDMTHLESGELAYTTEATDIRRIVSGIYRTWKDKVDEDNVLVTCGVADNVPDMLMLDAARVTKSLNNLVSNAVKFTHKGRIHIHITINDIAGQPGDDENVTELSLIVIDTGIGITDDMRANLFKPFVQADSSMTRNYGGAGIGLAVTRGFARLMGGDVEVTTKPSFGSEFAMRIKTVDASLAKLDAKTGFPTFDCIAELEHGINFSPVVKTEELQERERLKKEKAAREVNANSEQNIIPDTAAPLVLERARRIKREQAELAKQANNSLDQMSDQRVGFTRRKSRSGSDRIDSDQLEGLNVLIVEDILANQEVVRSLLEPAGCYVGAASNGVEALDLMKNQVFDVILMDIRMPIMGGIETIEHIRHYAGPHKSVPIVALTADASAENNAQCLAAGADVFLTKPVVVSELFASIRFVREKEFRKLDDILTA